MEVDVGSLDGQGLEDSFQGGWRDGINGTGDLAAHALEGFVEVVGPKVQLGIEVQEKGADLIVGFVHDVLGCSFPGGGSHLVQTDGNSPDEVFYRNKRDVLRGNFVARSGLTPPYELL